MKIFQHLGLSMSPNQLIVMANRIDWTEQTDGAEGAKVLKEGSPERLEKKKAWMKVLRGLILKSRLIR